MHPILGRVDRLAAYLAAWLVVCVLLAAVFTRLGLGWIEALAFLLPLFLVYAFVCLSAWYVSRATPLTTSGILRILASSGLAASVAGGLWLGLARAWVAALTATDMFAPAADRYARQMPFVFAIGVLLFVLAARRALRADRVRDRASGRTPSARARDAHAGRRAAGAAGANRSAFSLQQPQFDQRADGERPVGRPPHVPAARRVPAQHPACQHAAAHSAGRRTGARRRAS